MFKCFDIKIIFLTVAWMGVVVLSCATAGRAQFYFWLLSLVLTLTLIAASNRGELSLIIARIRSGRYLGEMILLTGIILLAAYLRTYNLYWLPIQLHNDEMSIGLEARKFLKDGTRPVFGTGWFGHSSLHYFLYALLISGFSDSLMGLRLASVAFSLGSIVGAYFLARLLFGREVAILSVVIITYYHFHLHFSRAGFHNIQAAFFSVFVLAFYVGALKNHSNILWTLTGMTLAVALQAYSANHFLPLFIFGTAITLATTDRYRASIRQGMPYLIISCFVALAPHIAFYFTESDFDLFPRSQGVFVFSSDNLRHMESVMGSSEKSEVLWYQLERNVQFFLGKGDKSMQYGFQGRFIDPAVLSFFLIGLFCFAVRSSWRMGGGLAAAFLFGTALIGGVLTIDPPWPPRLIVLSLIIPIISASGLVLSRDWLIAIFPKWRLALPRLMIVLIVSISALWNIDAYFNKHVMHGPWSERDIICRVIDKNGDVASVLNLFETEQNFSYESFEFMAPGTRGFESLDQLTEIDYDTLFPMLFVSHDEDVTGFVKSDIRGTIIHPRGSLVWSLILDQDGVE